jgi:hypothetical protein
LLQHSCLWLRHDEIEMNYMINLAYEKSTVGLVGLHGGGVQLHHEK